MLRLVQHLSRPRPLPSSDLAPSPRAPAPRQAAPVAQSGLTAAVFAAGHCPCRTAAPLGPIGKLLILDAWRDQAALICPPCSSSFVMVLGLPARARLLLEGKRPAPAARTSPLNRWPLPRPSRLAGLVALDCPSRPVTGWFLDHRRKPVRTASLHRRRQPAGGGAFETPLSPSCPCRWPSPRSGSFLSITGRSAAWFCTRSSRP